MARSTVLLATLLVVPLVVFAQPAPAATAFTAAFDPHDGNEWWVQTRVDASASLASVEARGPDGAWRALSLRSWGSWAASFHVPDGSLVTFRATSTGGETVTSGAFRWPGGEPADGGSAPPPPSSDFAAEFHGVGGNEWWVQASVRTDRSLAGVDSRVNGGAWRALADKGWGWADSFHVPDGSIVEFRARATDGATATSGGYRWPDATPTSGDGGSGGGADDDGTFSATFSGVAGNEWWVQVSVKSSSSLAGVDARVDGGAWRALADKGWGWAASFHVPQGSIVEFRARATNGETALSGGYRWPDATPTSSDGGGSGGGDGSGLRLVVDASRGPWGGGRVDIDRPFYGMNVADWHTRDYRPDPAEPYTTYLRALEPGVLRWPAGHTSQSTVWERTPDQSWGSRWLTTSHMDDFVQLSRAVGAQPLIAVNMKTATAQQAADMVRYANVERGYGVTWWQLGNEPDHRDGETSGPDEYAQHAITFARAMRAVDPSIKLVGGEIMTGAHVVGSNGAKDWMTPILQQAGREFDGVSWHYYPLDSNQESTSSSAYPTVDNLFQETATDWRPSSLAFADEIFPHLKGQRDSYAPGAGIWVTEIAEDSANGGDPDIVGTTAGMLWTADVMGRFARHGPDAVVKFVFASGSGHQFTLLDPDRNPRPAYYAYWLLARHFGDDIAYAASDDIRSVAVHSAVRDDGALTILLVNKRTDARDVSIDLQGFSATSAQRYVARGDWMGDKTVTINGATLHAGNVVGTSELQPEWIAVDDALGATLPPMSVTLIVLK